jgi:hypothetical protein
MKSFVRLAILACAVMLVGSAAVTYAIERRRVQNATASQLALSAVPAPPASALRSTCEGLLAARNAMLHQTFDVAPGKVYGGPPAPVAFTGHPETNAFHAKIRELVAGGVNFGGRYVVATWDCGDSCQEHAVVDAMTGAIVAFGLRTEMGVQYSPFSRLLITNPKANFPTPVAAHTSALDLAQRYGWMAREYYEVTDSNTTSYLTKVCVENAFDGQRF